MIRSLCTVLNRPLEVFSVGVATFKNFLLDPKKSPVSLDKGAFLPIAASYFKV
jgi:hypothetical protein